CAGALVNEKGPNSAAYVVDVEGRTMGVQTGDQWPQGKLDEMYDAAYGPLATDDWAGSANALMDTALGAGGGDGNGGAWLAGAGGAAVVAGGGIWAYTRKRTKKESAAVLRSEERRVGKGRRAACGERPARGRRKRAQ